jgi:hypothetical protein
VFIIDTVTAVGFPALKYYKRMVGQMIKQEISPS